MVFQSALKSIKFLNFIAKLPNYNYIDEKNRKRLRHKLRYLKDVFILALIRKIYRNEQRKRS